MGEGRGGTLIITCNGGTVEGGGGEVGGRSLSVGGVNL